MSSHAKRLKRSRLGRVDNLPWLKELYKKTWNKDATALFRQVEVTRAHYDALQNNLNKKYPDRGSETYDGDRNDVLSDKLRILAAPVHNNLDRVDDADNTDDDEINSLFPSTLKYLDLSTLQLECQSNRFPPIIFLREEYNYISELIKKRPSNGRGSVVLSGQHGTGKTVYLYFRIIESLAAGRPFLYQTKDEVVYHVTENGVEAIESLSAPKTHTMAFVDGDSEDETYEPRDFLCSRNVQIIMATFLKGAHQKWIEQTMASYHTVVTNLITSLWSVDEVFLTGIFLYPRDITFKLLKESTSYYGYNPRECFKASSSMTQLATKKREVLNLIRYVDEERILKALHSCVRGADTVSEYFFQVCPNPNDGFRRLENCHREAVSRWVFTSLLNVCEKEEAGATARLYRRLSKIPWEGAIWGLLYERLVLDYLDRIDEERKLPIHRLTRNDDDATCSDDDTTWIYRGPIDRLNLQEADVIKYINSAVENNKPLHLVPSVSNFAAVDSIVYCPTDVLTCIQVTINSEHPIAVTDLKRIQRWLKRTADLPKRARPWRFIFIVPTHMKTSFRWQKFDGDTELGEWAGKVNQYVCGLDV